MKNARNLGLRLDQTMTDRLEAFEKATKIEGVTLARAALEAALDAYHRTGHIAFPLRLESTTTPIAAPRHDLALVAEKPADYKTPARKKATA